MITLRTATASALVLRVAMAGTIRGPSFTALTDQAWGAEVWGSRPRWAAARPERWRPVHALTGLPPRAGVVLAQEPIEHGKDKSASELPVAPALPAWERQRR